MDTRYYGPGAGLGSAGAAFYSCKSVDSAALGHPAPPYRLGSSPERPRGGSPAQREFGARSLTFTHLSADSMDLTRSYIDGAFVDLHSERTIDVINPATQEVIARVPDGDAIDVDRAVRAARRAFERRPGVK